MDNRNRITLIYLKYEDYNHSLFALPLNNDIHVHQVFCSHNLFVSCFSKFDIRLLQSLIEHYPENLNLTTTPNHLYLICFSFLQIYMWCINIKHINASIIGNFSFDNLLCFFFVDSLFSARKSKVFEGRCIWSMSKLTAELSSNTWMNCYEIDVIILD